VAAIRFHNKKKNVQYVNVTFDSQLKPTVNILEYLVMNGWRLLKHFPINLIPDQFYWWGRPTGIIWYTLSHEAISGTSIHWRKSKPVCELWRFTGYS